MKTLFANKKKPFMSNILFFFIVTVCLIGGKLFFSSRTVFLCRHALFVISSSSMEPEYPINSIVIIKKTSFSQLEVGDVIAFKSDALNGGLALHRIVEVDKEGVYTKGDNNNIVDNQLITAETFVGRKAGSITFFARYLAKLDSPAGFLLFFLIPATGISLCYMSIKLLKKEDII